MNHADGKVRLADLERENRLLELDRAWLVERENHYFPNGNHRSLPTKQHAWMSGFVAVFLIIVSVVIAWNGSVKPIFVIVLFAMLLFTCILTIVLYTAAKEYEQAKQRYERERLRIQHHE